MNMSMMGFIKLPKYVLLLVLFAFCTSCADQASDQGMTPEAIEAQKKEDHKNFHITLKKLIQAIKDKDYASLETLMAPDELMHLVRPQTAVIYSSFEYLKFHKTWFDTDGWRYNAKITDSAVGADMGFALTEVMYSENERDGKPYWNKMAVTYTLKKYDDGNWYIIADHSSSIKKATD